MNTTRNFITAITATSMMTLFSYHISRKKKKQFREPELLNTLIKRSLPDKYYANTEGWIVHYIVGLLFCSIYDEVRRKTRMQPSLTGGALFGLACGITGVAGWNLTLKAHPRPPHIKLKKFFIQLIAAHVVFGIGTAMTHKILPDIKSVSTNSSNQKT